MDSGTAGHNYPKPHAGNRIQSLVPNPGIAAGRLGYSPYGYHPSLQSILGFNGIRLDAVTQLYTLGNGRRVFSPSLMRFSSPDSMSPFAAGGLNAYAYCLGDPVNREDPSGNISLFKPLARFFRNLFSKKKPDTFGASQPQPTLGGKLYYRDTNEVGIEFYTKTYNRIPSNAKINVVQRAESVPEGFVLRLLYGSPKQNADSLMAGLNLNYAKRGSYGYGVYGSTHIDVASKYGDIFGFYVHKSTSWVEGKDYHVINRNVTMIDESAVGKVFVSGEIMFPLLVSLKGYKVRSPGPPR